MAGPRRRRRELDHLVVHDPGEWDSHVAPPHRDNDLGVATTNDFAPGTGQVSRTRLHRRISILTVVFLAIHVVTSVDSFVTISWLAIVVPFTSSFSRFWVGLGAVALDLMIAVIVSSLLRPHLKPGTWRGIHWLAYLCWPVALVHTIGMGTDARTHWVLALVFACVVAVGGAVAWRLSTTPTANATVNTGAPRVAAPTRLVASARSNELPHDK